MGGVFQNSALTTTVQYMYNTIPDVDAQTFITAANITNGIQKIAINTLVIDLKGYGIWTKQRALYPVVGGVAASHAVNLKTPGTYNLSFTAGWVHSSTGMTPNGTSDYADTNLIPLSALNNFNSHLSYYSRTNSTSTAYNDCGNQDDFPQPNPGRQVYVAFGSTIVYSNQNSDANRIVLSDVDSLGLRLVSRTSNSSLKAYKNSSLVGTNTTTSSGERTNISIYLGGFQYRNSLGVLSKYYGIRQCAFASIGDGLTDTEAANFYTAVQKFQGILGRQV
jgi:hypothetical protein